MSVLLAFENVSKVFEPQRPRRSLVTTLLSRSAYDDQPLPIFEGVNLSVSAGEAVGILGGNGAGKTTLLCLAAGLFAPSSGRIVRQADVLALFAWNGCFIDDLSACDNIELYGAFLRLSQRQLREKQDEIFAQAGLAAHREDLLRTFSPGMKARLTLAVAAHSAARIVLIDEVHSAMDADAQQSTFELMQRWKREGRAILHVTHHRELHDRLSDRCFDLSASPRAEAQPRRA